MTIQPLFQTRTDISARLSKSPQVFPSFAGVYSSKKTTSKTKHAWIRSLCMIILEISTFDKNGPNVSKGKGYRMHNSKLRLHLNCAINNPHVFTRCTTFSVKENNTYIYLLFIFTHIYMYICIYYFIYIVMNIYIIYIYCFLYIYIYI